MPEDSGSRYRSPAFSLKWGDVLVRKVRQLSFLAQILFELSQKKTKGGQIDNRGLISKTPKIYVRNLIDRIAR